MPSTITPQPRAASMSDRTAGASSSTPCPATEIVAVASTSMITDFAGMNSNRRFQIRLACVSFRVRVGSSAVIRSRSKPCIRGLGRLVAAVSERRQPWLSMHWSTCSMAKSMASVGLMAAPRARRVSTSGTVAMSSRVSARIPAPNDPKGAWRCRTPAMTRPSRGCHGVRSSWRPVRTRPTIRVEPRERIELSTFSLRVKCSTD